MPPFVYNRRMRILAVDPGEKRLGIAVSDPTGTIATPHSVVLHRSKREDALRIVALAIENGCERIVVGVALNADGGETESSRRARNLAGEIAENTDIQVQTWDEGNSTQRARDAALELGISRRKRRGHLDDKAAAVILQSYLDSHQYRINNRNE